MMSLSFFQLYILLAFSIMTRHTISPHHSGTLDQIYIHCILYKQRMYTSNRQQSQRQDVTVRDVVRTHELNYSLRKRFGGVRVRVYFPEQRQVIELKLRFILKKSC